MRGFQTGGKRLFVRAREGGFLTKTPELGHLAGSAPNSTGAKMTGAELLKARIALGRMWGWERAVFATELGRALGNPAKDAGEIIRNCEARRDEDVPWLLAACVQMMQRGTFPPEGVPERRYDRTVKRARRREARA